MKTLTRRRLLRAAAAGAGASLFTPFYREAFAQSATKPARVVFVLECNCYYPVTVLSAMARAQLGAAVGTQRNCFNSAVPDDAR